MILSGLQDMTAWVDFSARGDAGAANGFDVAAQDGQLEFLIAHGLDEIFASAFAAAADETGRYRLAQEVKRLSLPGQMGDAFQVLELKRR